MNTRRNVDTRKRKTLKTFGGLGAGAALASMPALAAAASAIGTDGSSSLPEQLEITLISSPDVVENTLLVKNISQSAVTIDTFHAGNVFFDGDIIDCNGSCVDKAISLQPGEERAFYVSQLSDHVASSSAFEYLNAQAATNYLPRGTRVVNLRATVIGYAGYMRNGPMAIAA